MEYNIFGTIARVILNFNNHQLNQKLIKLAAKILTYWEKGFKIIDENTESNLVSVYMSTVNLWFKNFDYKKMDEENYLEIVECEE